MAGLGERLGLFFVDCLLVAITALIVWRIARQAIGKDTALVAVLLYLAAETVPWAQSPNMTERLLTLLVAAAYWAAMRGLASPGGRSWVAAGLACGLAVLVKQPAALDIAVLAAMIVLGAPRRLFAVSVFLLSALLPVAGAGASLTALGAGADAYDQVIVYNQLYMRAALPWAPAEWARAVLLIVLINGPLLVLAAVGLRDRLHWRRSAQVMPFLWFLAALVEGLSGARSYMHYFLPALPPLAILAASSLSTPLGPTFRGKLAARMPRLTVIWLACWLGAILSSGAGSAESRLPDDLGKWAGTCGSRADTTYVWGSEAELYLASGRRSPTRYFYNHPLIDQFGGIAGVGYASEERWRELMDDIRESPPASVLVAPEHYVPPESDLARFLEDYRPGPEFGEWRTYARPDLLCPELRSAIRESPRTLV